jgi:dolichol-phosphate mannosyltransferase
MSAPILSVVVPVFNEMDNIEPLISEILGALREQIAFEIVIVNDASRDQTSERLQALQPKTPELRVMTHAKQSGQSTAIRNGVQAARGVWIATLDGDGQNPPMDILKLLAARNVEPSVKLFAGWRVDRKDTASKRWASRIANSIRSKMLRDATPDTGCGLKLFERDAFLQLPYFDHMHRYLPALMQRAGYKCMSVPVSHRARQTGVSKYSNLQRMWVGISDLLGVAWLIRRSKITAIQEQSR